MNAVNAVSAATWMVLAASAIAAYTDLRWRKVPNWLTFGLAGAVVAAHACEGLAALATSLAVLGAVFAIGLFAFSLRVLGGGDVKLIAAAAAGFSFPDCGQFLLCTALSGGCLAIAVASARGRAGALISNTIAMIRPLVYAGTVSVTPSSSTSLPYAVAIAAGAAVVVLLKQHLIRL